MYLQFDSVFRYISRELCDIYAREFLLQFPDTSIGAA
jgi:hypothetical protein